ncbi:mandelate racemase/muconate lactonizing enzyme family protein [Microlunatus flavus]|uniref:L-alanine-DL-glutamate epimerase n=1 Tax=Microlunatus flavus TaxID=1036181 RepID=A0A1H9KDP6_9ACTN|nr:mandelate racemase/muconate lactonizing enzyme family protein [Microlunatus flavus]SEQ97168.1 L-alanine-DL-glutamate epimerase [Microlunatus flavus]
MKIIDVRGALIGRNPVIRVLTDEGVDGFGQAEWSVPQVISVVPMFRDLLIGLDPTDIEHCMLAIRRSGGFKPWGAVVSAIDLALHDLVGRYYGVPVHKLLGGKVRDRVRVYNGGVRPGPEGVGREHYPSRGTTPEDYASRMRHMKAAAEGFTIIKEGVGFHDYSVQTTRGLAFNDGRVGDTHPNRGPLTPRGLRHIVDCVRAMKSELGDEIGLALDMGPGWTVSDAIRVMREIEPLGIMWGEDLLSGNFVPWVHVAEYKELTRSTSTPTHTGEQIYLRHNFRELIGQQAVRVIGPEMLDVGGMAELKWVAELADLYGIGVAPHGVHDGLLGLAALVQVCATLPDNFIAFEYPVAEDPWWYDIVTGLPSRIVVDGFIQVPDAPGLGVRFDVEATRRYLRPEDRDFFDWPGSASAPR